MYAAAAALLIPFMVSCEKNQEFSGTPVSFNISSISAPETKADYSGVITDNKERVDWTSGDLIRIYSATSGPTSADYKIGTVTASGAVSSAAISPDGAAEIEWSKGENVFYGVFPSPKVKTADVMGEGTVKGNIPSVQTPLSLNESTPYVAKPNMTNCYMVARTVKTYTEGSDEVSLDFTPITTAIQFEITNNFSNDGVLKIKSISLISENRNISGTFTATLTGWASGYPACAAPATDDGGETVTVDFSSTALCSTGLAKGEKLTFTVFLRPTSNADDLTFKITKSDDSWISTKLMTSGSYIDFPCHKKSYVTGLLIPEGAQWTVKYDPDVASWNQGTGYLNPDAKINEDPDVVSWNANTNDLNLIEKEPKIYYYTTSNDEGVTVQKIEFAGGNLYCYQSTDTFPNTFSFHFENHQWENRAMSAITNDNISFLLVSGKVVKGETPLYTSGLFQWHTTDQYGHGAFTKEVVGTLSGSTSDVLDWGVAYNNSNGTSGWRTLTGAEWGYTLQRRETVLGDDYRCRWTYVDTGYKYATGEKAYMNGVLLFPDNWDETDPEFKDGDPIPEHCVFLPAAGYRKKAGDGTDGERGRLVNWGTRGMYWACDASSEKVTDAHGPDLTSSGSWEDADDRAYGMSIRLVKNVSDLYPGPKSK